MYAMVQNWTKRAGEGARCSFCLFHFSLNFLNAKFQGLNYIGKPSFHKGDSTWMVFSEHSLALGTKSASREKRDSSRQV